MVANALFAIGLSRNDRLDLVFLEEGTERIGVIAFVGEKLTDAGDQADASFRHDAVGGIARREDEDPGSAELIDDCMNFAVAPAFRDADRLLLRPPFPPLAQR